mgnify:CR=1 FL=1
MPIKQKVLIASSLHPWDDPRIFYKQCHSLKKHYDLTLIAVSERKLFNKDDIRIIGLSKPKSLVYRLINSVKIVREVFKEKYIIFHFLPLVNFAPLDELCNFNLFFILFVYPAYVNNLLL